MAKITKEEIEKVRGVISDTIQDGSRDTDERGILLLVNIIGLFPYCLFQGDSALEKLYQSEGNKYNV